jgi:hypothetical protein
MRGALQILIPLLLPTAAYFLYVGFVQRRSGAGANTAPDVPWTWLAVAGVALLAISLVAFTMFGGAPPGSRYEPAQLIDGKIEPGKLN